MTIQVMHLTLSFARGGRRQAIQTLLRRLPDLEVDCDLVCLDELGCDPFEIEPLVGAFACLERRSLLDARAVRRLVALCRRRGTQVIHAHDAASQFTAALARLRLPRLRLLMTFHRSLGFESATRPDRLRNALAGFASQAIVTGSRERRAHYLAENHVPTAKVVRIPFGIDVGRFRPDTSTRATLRHELGLTPETTVLGAVGHFGPEKGLDVTLHAYAELVRRGTCGPMVLVVVGDGTEDQRRAMRAVADAIPSRIEFVGFRPDVERWFRAFDIFVHGARQEAFGLVLAEAMATGLPVAATQVGGIPDLVREGCTGFLALPEQPAALADAIERLVRDRTLRASLGAESRRVAQTEYDADLAARRHAQLYRDLLDGRPPRGVEDATGPRDAESSLLGRGAGHQAAPVGN